MIRKDLLMVGLMMAILALMVVPIGSGMIDVLIAVNLSLGILLLMVAVYIRQPSDFSTFPSVILLGTAFRLALSIGTTRLILSEAEGGAIIDTFGEFVIRGNVAIGLVVFLIITVVQFLVITKGAERVAEVGARFALDALPGKQMSIDADVRAGNIEQDEAVILRKQLNRDSQFFGAMDGAMKFVKGDAIAGLIIICINLLGGISIGVGVHGMDFSEAVSVYSLLTIGDGLVAQLPALVMSFCAGVIVTRTASNENEDLGSDITKELIADPRVPGAAALVLVLVGFIPGFPLWIFMVTATLLFFVMLFLRRRLWQTAAELAEDLETPASAEDTETARSVSERLVVHLHPSLSKSVDMVKISENIQEMFLHLRETRGVDFPSAKLTSSSRYLENTLTVTLDDVPIYRQKVLSDMVMISDGLELLEVSMRANGEEIEFINADIPNSNVYWVPNTALDKLIELNLEPESTERVLAELVFRIYERNLGSLFSNNEFNIILAEATEIDSDGIGSILERLPRQSLFQVFRDLVEDGVPVRPLRVVVEALLYWTNANENASPTLISECLRGSLKRQLCYSIAGDENILGVAMIDPKLEELARQGLAEVKRTGSLSSMDGLVFPQDVTDDLIRQFETLYNNNLQNRDQVAVVTTTDLRRRLRNFLAANNIHLPVLAPHEISPNVETFPVELISTKKREGVRNTRARRLRLEKEEARGSEDAA